jgi:hypothetical protein
MPCLVRGGRCQPKCFVEGSAVSLVDHGEQFGQISQSRMGFDGFVEDERFGCRRRGCENGLGSLLSSCADAMRAR